MVIEKGSGKVEEKKQLKEEYLEKLKKFRLMDDDFMSKCFEDNIECTELVVRIVLNREDLKIEKVHAQHRIKNLQGRSIILDIYATDGQGKKYNIEIQRSDKGAHAKRARYNSSLIDANITEPGEAYENLAETYVIFITEKDVLGYGLPIYHIERMIQEVEEVFDDGEHIIYVNGEYRDDSPIGILMQDFSCTDPEKIHYKQLAERIRYFKEDEKGVAVMCKMMEDMKNEAELGIKKKMAIKLLIEGKRSVEDIAEFTELSIKEVEELVKHIEKHIEK